MAMLRRKTVCPRMPGLETSQIREDHVITPVLPTYARAPIALERGEGAHVVDTQGRRYLDFGSGIAVNALGHAHPVLVKVLTEQAQKLWHTSNLYRVPAQERLAERLVELTFADTVFFSNSGAEALECAIKMARKYHAHLGAPQRYRLITFEGAFHGRTLATIAAGGQKKYLDGFGPKVDGFDQVGFCDLDAVRKAIGPETAGILIEPIQGEGGVRVVEPQKMRALREICDANGLLFILDEVQSGMGRTGKLFAHEWSGITPDIMAVSKALGGGFPVAACLATEKAAAGMTAGTHGSTFGGNPLAMEVAKAAVDLIADPALLDHVVRISNYLQQQLQMVRDRNGAIIEEVRGQGLLLGLKCRVLNSTLVEALRERGLLAVGAGDNVVRILPPLIINEEDVREAIGILNDACASLAVQTPKEAAK
jgi:acetylornithine/N-succinyldiaminopimelate aminotransferase